jgi:hypothetical protein
MSERYLHSRDEILSFTNQKQNRQNDADKKPPMMRQGHHEGMNVINRTAVQNRK